LKKAWYEYIEEIGEMCAGLDAMKAGEIGERLVRISRGKLFEVEYDGSGDPYVGYQTYTPKSTPFNLDKHHIVTELRACVELLRDVGQGQVGVMEQENTQDAQAKVKAMLTASSSRGDQPFHPVAGWGPWGQSSSPHTPRDEEWAQRR
jgi:hypothetical protein